MKTFLWPSLALTLTLLVTCHARATSSDASDFMKMLQTKDDMGPSQSRSSSGFRLEQAGDFSLPVDSQSDSSSLSSSSSSSIQSSQLLGGNRHSFWNYPSHPVRFADGSDVDDDENSINSDDESKFREDGSLLRLREEIAMLKNQLLAAAMASHDSEGLEKRFRPSGFMGSRGKRFIPGLETLLLAKYYQDAEKWKRQPHGGFHGSRG